MIKKFVYYIIDVISIIFIIMLIYKFFIVKLVVILVFSCIYLVLVERKREN